MTRIDAVHNRDHIVAVARAAFGAHGMQVPTREIARQAGIGAATVYRHFPARPDLVDAVLSAQIADCAEDLRGALDLPDPRLALSTVVRHFARWQVSSRGLMGALAGTAGVAADRRAHAAALDRLAIRAGVPVSDVRVGLTAIASIRVDRVGQLTDLVLAGLLR